jgi:hypothetical protein
MERRCGDAGPELGQDSLREHSRELDSMVDPGTLGSPGLGPPHPVGRDTVNLARSVTRLSHEHVATTAGAAVLLDIHLHTFPCGGLAAILDAWCSTSPWWEPAA